MPPEGQDRRVLATCLRGILSSDALLPAIEDAVCRMTGIVSEATRFANGFLIHQHESGAAVPNLGCGSAGSVGFDFFREVTGQSASNADVERFRITIYARTRPPTLSCCDGTMISRLMVNAATLYAANCRSHWAIHIKSELRHWFEYKLDKALHDILDLDGRDQLVEYAQEADL